MTRRSVTPAVLVAIAALGLAMPPARGQILDPTTTTTTTTTEPEPTTTTTAPPDTEPDPTTTTEARTTTTAADDEPEEPATTTSTTTPVLLVEGPPAAVAGAPAQATTTTAVTDDDSDGDDTGRLVAFVVGGFILLGLAVAAFTVWFWRRTRPRLVAAPLEAEVAPASQRSDRRGHPVRARPLVAHTAPVVAPPAGVRAAPVYEGDDESFRPAADDGYDEWDDLAEYGEEDDPYDDSAYYEDDWDDPGYDDDTTTTDGATNGRGRHG